MDELIRYQVIYTETAVRDIEEKADYIAFRFADPALAETWYLRLRTEIQDDLSVFPYKYQPYTIAPWGEKGIHLFLSRNDVVLYSVAETERVVYIHGVCTKGRDLPAHLGEILPGL